MEREKRRTKRKDRVYEQRTIEEMELEQGYEEKGEQKEKAIREEMRRMRTKNKGEEKEEL